MPWNMLHAMSCCVMTFIGDPSELVGQRWPQQHAVVLLGGSDRMKPAAVRGVGGSQGQSRGSGYACGMQMHVLESDRPCRL